ncbi:FGFR1 oncogene partner 2 homolog [Pecten maximus]|uniref:FGFR1 oncogene partner 2 homolog n=1 Tax=Pecten maximus TaxID=6579 RepID=UPI001458C601|nr:FGFR1 oncogene partner 2 homolog [Pecten maximus]XP_033751870.1 FGFR1 oncogene partner 2 homolog [Pecten maximus]
MAMSVDKLLADAQILVARLRTHDTTADILIAHTQTLHKRLDAMKEYQDDITELNEIARHRPRSTLVLGIAQENRQIRELQQENRELRCSLEEHQNALELIMQKYREQMTKLIQANNFENVIAEKRDQSKDLERLIDKICEMAAVMQRAVMVDQDASAKDQELFTQLQKENNGLRELLEVCTTAKQKILQSITVEQDDKYCQTEEMSGEKTPTAELEQEPV